jgi:hypothetical protein
MEIIKLNENINTQKPSLLFYIHLGFGDLLNMSGAIRFLSKTFKMTVTISPIHINNAKILFNDIEDISFLLTNHYYNDAEREYDILNSYYDKVLKTGFHNKDFICLDNKPHIKFYEIIGLNMDIYRDFFVKKNIYNPNFELIKNTKYFFCHTQASQYEYHIELNTDDIIICPNKNYYNKDHIFYKTAELFVGLSFFEYTDIIENAEEIHVVDSSFACYAILLRQYLKASKKYCYCRGPHYQYLDNTWYWKQNVLKNKDIKLK